MDNFCGRAFQKQRLEGISRDNFSGKKAREGQLMCQSTLIKVFAKFLIHSKDNDIMNK